MKPAFAVREGNRDRCALPLIDCSPTQCEVDLSMCLAAKDTDGDEVADGVDNCMWVPNGLNEPTGAPRWGNHGKKLEEHIRHGDAFGRCE